jgi:putative hydrolase of the HAD superfamily
MNEQHFAVIFDLDDTLYKEIDFLKSAFWEIAKMLSKNDSESLYMEMIALYKEKINVFKWLSEQYTQLNINQLLINYRKHIPQIDLYPGARAFLDKLKNSNIPMGLITDGRSLTQRNKLKSLNIEKYFKDIIISEEFGSEKPTLANFVFFEEKYTGYSFVYIGDNINKDFIAPNKLNWDTWCLIDNGQNIHNQFLDKNDFPDKTHYYPKNFFSEFKNIIL